MESKALHIDHINRVYFLGVGGIGMSAIARYFLLQGAEVSGYDKTKTPLTEQLEKEGVEIHYEENPDAIPEQLDLIVYTPAIPEEHAEWEKIRTLQVPIKKRAEVLGLISQGRRTIAVAGTHGKTSTSSMTTAFLRSAGKDVTGFLGGIVKDFKSNFVHGKSDWVVVEADEFDRSFMHLNPEICVLLSMDADHLDIYGDHTEMMHTFRDFTLNIKDGGSLLIAASIVHMLDLEWKKALLDKDIKIFSFGNNEGWYKSLNLEPAQHTFQFEFHKHEAFQFASHIAMPGKHNVSNATGALGVCDILECDHQKLATAVQEFQGIARRFDFGKKSENQIYIDDYAHHPSEIKVAIQAAKDLYPHKELTVVFQPHLFSRTKDFIDEFAEELSEADELILMDIYPAREKPIPGVTSEVLSRKIKNKKVPVWNEQQVIEYVEKRKNDLEVFMTMGAGNIDRLVQPIKTILNN